MESSRNIIISLRNENHLSNEKKKNGEIIENRNLKGFDVPNADRQRWILLRFFFRFTSDLTNKKDFLFA